MPFTVNIPADVIRRMNEQLGRAVYAPAQYARSVDAAFSPSPSPEEMYFLNFSGEAISRSGTLLVRMMDGTIYAACDPGEEIRYVEYTRGYDYAPAVHEVSDAHSTVTMEAKPPRRTYERWRGFKNYEVNFFDEGFPDHL